MSDSVELIKCVGRGNQGYAKKDVVNKRYWTILKECTCDDDPYGKACSFCLCERGHSGFYSDAEVIAFLKPATCATDPLLDEMAEVAGKIEKYYDFPSEVLEEIAPEWLIDVIHVMKKYRERQSLANPNPQPPQP